jgi:predicted GNAT family acetyltransferase
MAKMKKKPDADAPAPHGGEKFQRPENPRTGKIYYWITVRRRADGKVVHVPIRTPPKGKGGRRLAAKYNARQRAQAKGGTGAGRQREAGNLRSMRESAAEYRKNTAGTPAASRTQLEGRQARARSMRRVEQTGGISKRGGIANTPERRAVIAQELRATHRLMAPDGKPAPKATPAKPASTPGALSGRIKGAQERFQTGQVRGTLTRMGQGKGSGSGPRKLDEAMAKLPAKRQTGIVAAVTGTKPKSARAGREELRRKAEFTANAGTRISGIDEIGSKAPAQQVIERQAGPTLREQAAKHREGKGSGRFAGTQEGRTRQVMAKMQKRYRDINRESTAASATVRGSQIAVKRAKDTLEETRRAPKKYAEDRAEAERELAAWEPRAQAATAKLDTLNRKHRRLQELAQRVGQFRRAQRG